MLMIVKIKQITIDKRADIDMLSPEERAKQEIMKELLISETEYENDKKRIENTLFFRGRVLKHSIDDLKRSTKNFFIYKER